MFANTIFSANDGVIADVLPSAPRSKSLELYPDVLLRQLAYNPLNDLGRLELFWISMKQYKNKTL